MKKTRLLSCGILGGIILAAFIWFVSWNWETHTHLSFGKRLTYFALEGGVVWFGSYTIKTTSSSPIFVFRGGEADGFAKENYLIGGMWYADAVPKGGYFGVPVWFAAMLAFIFGVGVAQEFLRNRKLANAFGGDNVGSMIPGVMPSAEQQGGGSRGDQ